MNQFVLGIRFGLLAIGLCVSVVAFADGNQSVGGGSPPCDPFVVTPPPEPDPTPPLVRNWEHVTISAYMVFLLSLLALP